MHVTLKIVNGEILEYDVTKPCFVIGRSNKCDVVVPHEGMSRLHCQIEFSDGEVFVTDLGSTNGVLIDGQKIGPHTKTPYATYLTLSFGAVTSLQIDTEKERTSSSLMNNYSLKPKATASPQKTMVLNNPNNSQNQGLNASSPLKPNKPNKIEKLKYIFINIIAFLILAGSIYWYMQKEDEPMNSTDSSELSSTVEEIKGSDAF
jgi:pSer/pThr/pTyr-binding forkhead associated (FHA) protein